MQVSGYDQYFAFIESYRACRTILYIVCGYTVYVVIYTNMQEFEEASFRIVVAFEEGRKELYGNNTQRASVISVKFCYCLYGGFSFYLKHFIK